MKPLYLILAIAILSLNDVSANGAYNTRLQPMDGSYLHSDRGLLEEIIEYILTVYNDEPLAFYAVRIAEPNRVDVLVSLRDNRNELHIHSCEYYNEAPWEKHTITFEPEHLQQIHSIFSAMLKEARYQKSTVISLHGRHYHYGLWEYGRAYE